MQVTVFTHKIKEATTRAHPYEDTTLVALEARDTDGGHLFLQQLADQPIEGLDQLIQALQVMRAHLVAEGPLTLPENDE